MKPERRALSLSLAGLGLILSGAAIWALLTDARSGYALRPTDFTAVPAEVNYVAPELRLRDLEGSEHSLSDYSGKVILVNLWATWCPPCTAEMPVYQRFFEQHRQEGFTVIAINDGESASDVRKFVAEYDLTFPVWLDPTYEATERAFRSSNLPTTYVIDRGGMVRLVWIGAISERNLNRHVLPLVKE